MKKDYFKSNIMPLFIVVVLSLLSFLLCYYKLINVDYQSCQGAYLSVSASTLKFVNQWLEEGALRLHFTCYECFNSIEFTSLAERCPYISYPTGSTFIVWILAKIANRTHIGISFLKHLQAIFFCIETLAISVMTYLVLQKYIKIAVKLSIIISTLAGAFWVCLPGNAWYLSNVLYADQMIIMFVCLLLLLEYFEDCYLKKSNYFIIAFKCFLIYFGILTDYYFWILIFTIVILKLIRYFLQKKNFRSILRKLSVYLIPSCLSLITFIWQVSYTQGWLSRLKGKFVGRTIGQAEGSLFGQFCKVYTNESYFIGGLLITSVIIMAIISVFIIIKCKKVRSIFLSDGLGTLVAGIVAPILQIMIFRNHSINHTFSMVKLSWVIIYIPILFALSLHQYKLIKNQELQSNNDIGMIILVFVLMFGYIINIPYSTREFIAKANTSQSFAMEIRVNELTDYDDLLFSFDQGIGYDDSMELAISEKCVHHIDNMDEIQQYLVKIEQVNRKVDSIYFVIDKYVEETDESDIIKQTKNNLLNDKKIVYEDEHYYIIEL